LSFEVATDSLCLMAWGYGSDSLSPGLFLALVTQAGLFLLLVGPAIRRLASVWSSVRLTLAAAAAITGSTACYQALFPVLRIGVTSGLLTLFVTLPLTLINSAMFSVRAFRNQAPARHSALVFAVIPVNIAYWAWFLAWSRGEG
jgi:hypothetical protein